MGRQRRWIGIGVAACVLLAGCNGVRRLTANTKEDSRCFTSSISGDGRYVVLSTLDDPTGRTQDEVTVLRRADGSASAQVAGNGSTAVTGGSISRDGALVALTISVRVGGHAEQRGFIWRKANGARSQITPDGESVNGLVLSADGKKAAYESGGTIWRYDVHTGTRKQASPTATDAQTAYSPALSADGRYLTYLTRRGSSSKGLAYVDSQSGTVHQLVGLLQDGWPTTHAPLSDDGRFVAYAMADPSIAGGAPQVYLWDRTVGFPARQTDVRYPVYLGDATVSGDGSRIVYSRYDGPGGTLLVQARGSTATATAVRANGPISSVAVSTDGHAVAFCSNATDLPSSNGRSAPNTYVWTDR